MEDHSVNMDLDLGDINDDISQSELDAWLHTTDFEQEAERLWPAQAVTAPPVQRPKRRDSFEYGLEEDVFGIDFQTALRAADQKVGAETQNPWVSSASSSKSQSQTHTSLRPVTDLTTTKPTTIDLTTTDTLPQTPGTCVQARKTFDIINIDHSRQTNSLLERRISLPEPMHPTSIMNSSPSRSFFRDMDEHSSRFRRILSSSSAVSYVGDDMNSMSDSIMSTRSHFNELQGAMAQTQQSRRMIIGALSDSERSDGNIDVASSAHVATAAAVKINNDVASRAHVAASAVKNIPEFVQPGLGVTSLPKPVQNSSNATRATNNDEMTEAEAKSRRALEIAREKMILEMRLAEMYRGVGR